MRGKLSKREYTAKMSGKPMPYENKRKMQMEALKKKVPVYKSGFDSKGNRIDFSNPKTKRGIISSID